MSDIKSLDDLKSAVGGAVAAPAAAVARVAVRDKLGRAYATGKRKNAIARVWIKPGSGKVVVNGKEMAAYFARPVLQMILRQPFTIANVEGQFDVMATVKGGGLSGQAGAFRFVVLHRPRDARVGRGVSGRGAGFGERGRSGPRDRPPDGT